MWLIESFEQKLEIKVKLNGSQYVEEIVDDIKSGILERMDIASKYKRSINFTKFGTTRGSFLIEFENTNENWFDVTISKIYSYRHVRDALGHLEGLFPKYDHARDPPLFEHFTIAMRGSWTKKESKLRVNLLLAQALLRSQNISTYYDEKLFPRLIYRTTLLNMYPRKRRTEDGGKKYQDVPKECVIFMNENGLFKIHDCHGIKLLETQVYHINNLINVCKQ